MEALVRLAVQPIAYCGNALLLIGLIYLGFQLKDGMQGSGGEQRKALGMIAAGAVITAFAILYGFTGF